MAIWDNIKLRYRSGNTLMRLIYVNVAVFLLLRVLAFVGLLLQLPLAALLVKWFELPSSALALLRVPWTVITYMFFHYDLWHILFNMLWLYWLGRIFLEYFNAKQLLGLFVLGGIGGACFYVLAYAWLPYFAMQESSLLGASASVLAIVLAVAVYAPHYKIGLLFLGEVSLKWVAIITVLFMVLSTSEANLGAQFAHAGGMAVGAVFGWQMHHGHDITAWLNAFFDSIATLFKRRGWVGQPVGGTAMHNQARHNAGKPTEEQVDAILDKLRRSGYDSLSDDEKRTLFRASSK